MNSDNFNFIKTNKRKNTTSDQYCTGRAPKPTDLDNYYQEGCYSKMKEIVRGRFIYIAAIILALIAIQFIGIISTCVLMCCRHKNTQQPPYINIATHEDAHYNL